MQECCMSEDTKNPAKVAAGRKGGLATVAKYGHHHMTAIAYGGMLVTAERHHGGDVSAMMADLRAHRTANAVWDDRLMCWKVSA